MFKKIITLIRQEKVSLFIGSGFSYEAQAPTARQLCDAILSQFDDNKKREDHKKDSLQEVSNFYVEDICCGSRNSLIELLQKQFNFSPAKMDDHEALAKIPHFHNIFTTNYDTLLEDSYHKEDCQIIRKDADCAYLDNNKPVKVFKIHGDFINQDFVVITSSDYNSFFTNKPNPQMWDVVKHDFLTKNILFIGYSLEDDNILHLIRNISDSIGKNQKEKFLIAPGLNSIKIKKLRAMGVKYYDAVATVFLKELIDELKANIVKDFKHHDVSAETFTRFCNIHNIDPTVNLQEKRDNQIVNFKPLNSHKLQQEIKMTLGLKNKEILEKMDFEKYGVIGINSQIPNVPFIHFTGNDLLNCAYTINGIVVNDEITSILLGPEINDFPLTIRIPSRNFLEKVVAKSYRLRKGKVVLDIDCHIYKTKMTLEVEDNKERGTRINISFDFVFNETFTNNNEAIKWIDLISAFYSKEDIFIKEILSVPINTSVCKDMNFNNHFNEYKMYYENIKQIEILNGENFTIYNRCTEERYRTSCIIVSYLMHQPVIFNCPGGFDFSVEAKFDFIHEEPIKVGNVTSIVTTEDGHKSYELNDRTFVIPYVHDLFYSCIVRKAVKQEDGYIKIDYRYDSESYTKLFSDKSVDEEFPGLTMLESYRNLIE